MTDTAERRPLTMAEVAASVGVSTRDVALSLAGDSSIPQERRVAISSGIEELGYRPLESLQVDLGRPLKLAIVFRAFTGDEPDANRFYAPVGSAIAQMCVRYGADVIRATMIVDEQYNPRQLPRALVDGSCDAVFLLGAHLDAEAIARVRSELPPVVLVDGYADGDGLDSVVTDNTLGARLAVEHLIAAGHREIALLGTEPVCYPSMQERRDGYTQVIREHGLSLHYVDTGYSLADAAGVLGVDYVQRHPRVTAVFGANDFLLVSFMSVARDSGYRLPRDISVVGFDDIDLASLVMPALTTLAVDKRWMGRAAFAVLAHRLEADPEVPLRAVVEPRLVERESVVAPKDAEQAGG